MKKNGERTPEQEANRVRTIKVVITALAIILIVMCAILTWNEGGGYQFKIRTKTGYEWQCTIEDTSLMQISSESLSNGKYICNIAGIKEGEGYVNLKCFETANPNHVIEERRYGFLVAEDGLIIQKSVQRKVHED